MRSREPAHATTRLIPARLIGGLVVLLAALAVAPGVPTQSSASSASASPRATSTPGAVAPHELPGAADLGALGEADGILPGPVTLFDERPGIQRLDGELRQALRRAAMDAAQAGVELRVESGWRSPAYQELLLRAAVAEYGSAEEAARWVASPATSAHVLGDAVDVAPADATAWLFAHGSAYGLCQIYANEPWHYELRPAAVDHGCPRMYADPTHDPRMQG